MEIVVHLKGIRMIFEIKKAATKIMRSLWLHHNPLYTVRVWVTWCFGDLQDLVMNSLKVGWEQRRTRCAWMSRVGHKFVCVCWNKVQGCVLKQVTLWLEIYFLLVATGRYFAFQRRSITCRSISKCDTLMLHTDTSIPQNKWFLNKWKWSVYSNCLFNQLYTFTLARMYDCTRTCKLESPTCAS